MVVCTASIHPVYIFISLLVSRSASICFLPHLHSISLHSYCWCISVLESLLCSLLCRKQCSQKVPLTLVPYPFTHLSQWFAWQSAGKWTSSPMLTFTLPYGHWFLCWVCLILFIHNSQLIYFLSHGVFSNISPHCPTSTCYIFLKFQQLFIFIQYIFIG